MYKIAYKVNSIKTGELIIKYLVSKGARNTYQYIGGLPWMYLLVDSTGEIVMKSYIPEGYIEGTIQDTTLDSDLFDEEIQRIKKIRMKYTKDQVIEILKDYDNSIFNLNTYISKKMNEEKEYKPVNIEDFHVGFEFEWRNDQGIWIKKKMDSLDYRVTSTMNLHRSYTIYPNRFRQINK